MSNPKRNRKIVIFIAIALIVITIISNRCAHSNRKLESSGYNGKLGDSLITIRLLASKTDVGGFIVNRNSGNIFNLKGKWKGKKSMKVLATSLQTQEVDEVSMEIIGDSLLKGTYKRTSDGRIIDFLLRRDVVIQQQVK